jgi:acyl-CoA reductase-like NAD-dependent aldehyde dehydrogenase
MTSPQEWAYGDPMSVQPLRTVDHFDSLNPSTGDVVGTHPIHTADDIAAALRRAQAAAVSWRKIGFAGRREMLDNWTRYLVAHAEDVMELLSLETGKRPGEAQMEMLMTVDHLHWAGKNAKKVLGRQRVKAGLLMANNRAYVEYPPLGVIGVIGPWNFPVFTPMGSIAYALAAGNAVVFKPSEYTPGVGVWLAESFAAANPDYADVFQVVTGLGETGAALCHSGVDKLAFTGSTRTGKRVMAACAETLTPVVIEGGGKDAFIVDEDVDIADAAEAALWAGMFNAGQACVGTERIYVHERVFDQFVTEIVEQARGLHASGSPDAKIGPITMPAQKEVIRSHLEDAIEKGATVMIGGPDTIDAGPGGMNCVQPTILTHVPENSLEMTDETFGPTLAINPVASMEEAVERTNASKYGLAGTVYSKRRGMEIAGQIRSGMTAVNSYLSYAGVPGLPFGGVGESGFGRIHGPDGLKEFTYAHAITDRRFKPMLALTTFNRSARTEKTAKRLMKMVYGR